MVGLASWPLAPYGKLAQAHGTIPLAGAMGFCKEWLQPSVFRQIGSGFHVLLENQIRFLHFDGKSNPLFDFDEKSNPLFGFWRCGRSEVS